MAIVKTIDNCLVNKNMKYVSIATFVIVSVVHLAVGRYLHIKEFIYMWYSNHLDSSSLANS